MKFSITTSFYNTPLHYIDRVYTQIKNQTYENWEWVVCDDFSDSGEVKDKLKQICEQDPKVKYYEVSKKKEKFWNPQLGCSGDWVVMFDDDDFHFPKVLEIYKHFIDKHPEVLGISSLATQYNGDEFKNYRVHADVIDKSCNRSSTFPYIRAWKNIVRDFVGGRELKFFQNDTNIVRQIEKHGQWLVVPRNLCKYSVREGSISNSKYNPKEIEEERQYIESRNKREEISYITKYYPVWEYCRAFTVYPELNEQSGLNLYFWAADLSYLEKELLKEVFFDHNLVFKPQDNVDMYFFYVDKGSLGRFTGLIEELKGNPYQLVYSGEEIDNKEMHNRVIGGWQTGVFCLYKQGIL